MIITGNSLDKLNELKDNSVDACVTDPPYELGFMSKSWDATGIAYNVELWSEVLRVLKPGGHLIAFGGTRTYHRMAVAIEDAGFEIRDMLEWIYASGFPKSQNIGKAYDKKMGNEREVTGERLVPDQRGGGISSERTAEKGGVPTRMAQDTKGTSPYEGLGTALKPAHEPMVLARKPLSEKTIVDNVVKWGTGGLSIDGCRIPTSEPIEQGREGRGVANSTSYHNGLQPTERTYTTGRFPANLAVTDDALNDGEMTKSQQSKRGLQHSGRHGGLADIGSNIKEGTDTVRGHSDQGSKSRYFDIDHWATKHGLLQFPKASKRERNEGLEGFEEKNNMRVNAPRADETQKHATKMANVHPTVKPVHLMSWLVKLVSREGDTVLDPFNGSGTTGVACAKLGREYIGVELDPEYVKISEARINAVEKGQGKLL